MGQSLLLVPLTGNGRRETARSPLSNVEPRRAYTGIRDRHFRNGLRFSVAFSMRAPSHLESQYQDWVPLLQAIVWPIFILILVQRFRGRLSNIFESIVYRIQQGDSFEAGTLGIKLAAAKPLSLVGPELRRGMQALLLATISLAADTSEEDKSGSGRSGVTSSEGRSLGIYRIALLVVPFLLPVLWPCLAEADTPKVAFGETVVLTSDDSAIEVKAEKDLKGSAVAIDTPYGAKKHALLYIAPVSLGTLTENVRYNIAGVEHSAAVEVCAEAPTLASGELYEQSFKALFALFILATILESGLAVVFNWRIFLKYFDAAGTRTLVSIVFSSVFVWLFGMDIVTSLVNVYTGGHLPANAPGKFITALVVAGGSSGVNRLMVSLGFRAVKTAADVTAKPKPSEAWISVHVERDSSVKGTIDVMMAIDPDTSKQPCDWNAQAIGSISGRSCRIPLLKVFLRDLGRFPGYGGHPVSFDKPIAIWVQHTDDKKETTYSGKVWGPYTVAAGALVDLEFRLS